MVVAANSSAQMRHRYLPIAAETPSLLSPPATMSAPARRLRKAGPSRVESQEGPSLVPPGSRAQNLPRNPTMSVRPGLYSVNVAFVNWKYWRSFASKRLVASKVSWNSWLQPSSLDKSTIDEKSHSV